MKGKLPRLRRRVTAYTFLRSVLPKVVLEEPRRMHMAVWRDTSYGMDERHKPACGTIGCIGGWTEVMVQGGSPWRHARRPARQILGLTPEQAEVLFYPLKLTGELHQGTLRHARAAVAHMQAFAEKHKAQLQAVMLEPSKEKP